MNTSDTAIYNNKDNHVDEELIAFLTQIPPKSFFLKAGAGSGKTQSLVNLLKNLQKERGQEYWLQGKKVAVVTYTKAASVNIRQRLGFHNLFEVSTIHSFVWTVIKAYTSDLRCELKNFLGADIEQLKKEEAKGRAGTKASKDRIRKIASKTERLEKLDSVIQFIYDPDGKNSQGNALGHSEVLSIGASLLTRKPLLQRIFVQTYPILLIDESQDTRGELIDAFFSIQKAHAERFAIGLFGDTLQRIYFDGKQDLARFIPDGWELPEKIMNHRSQKRIVDLIKLIGADMGGQDQLPRTENSVGCVRFFIAPTSSDRETIESQVAYNMVEYAQDSAWGSDYQKLLLEHHMAAIRLGFSAFFMPLYEIPDYKTSLLDGSLAEVKLFTEIMIPLATAYCSGDKFKIAEIVKKSSPLFHNKDDKPFLLTLDVLKKANDRTYQCMKLWDEGNDPSCKAVIQVLLDTGLFDIPESIANILDWDADDVNEQDKKSEAFLQSVAWDKALDCPVSEVQKYSKYIKGETSFATHQGVKGLEFPRVMAIMDDASARGTSFQYKKLFNMRETDDKILNVKRLFYVICSRARESLALVAYSDEPEEIQSYLTGKGWVHQDEIVML